MSTFDRTPKALSAVEIEKTLGYPKSSTLEVLKTLVHMGYLSFDQIAKTYYPTMLVTALGSSGFSSLSVFSNITAAMAEIASRTGRLAYLVSQNGFDAQIMATSEPAADQADVGRRTGLFTSIEGLALLANLSEAQLNRLVARRKASDAAQTHMDLVELGRLRGQTRLLGYASGPSGFFNGMVTTWPLYDGDGHPAALSAMDVSPALTAELTRIVQGAIATPPSRT